MSNIGGQEAADEQRNGFSKEKKTRRRQRVSCAECTKRRQKCDRQHPCGRCISRGVTHLCRWEAEPLARSTSSLSSALTAERESQLTSTISELGSRIALLERAILESTRPNAKNYPDLDAPMSDLQLPSVPQAIAEEQTRSPPQHTSVDDNFHTELSAPTTPDTPIKCDQSDTPTSLAQLSLGHYGEYVGHGTVVCAVYLLGDHLSAQFSYSQSTDITIAYSPNSPQIEPPPGRVQPLLLFLPRREEADALLDSFFTNLNWWFNIPESWFRRSYEQMWQAIEDSNGVKINPHWLSLLYAVLALTPNPIKENPTSPEEFFEQARAARRLGEDILLNSGPFSQIADGTVLSCVAAPILASYLADRGLLSEGWKLIGSAIRNALTIGMHRDPDWDKWAPMPDEEKVLRRTCWWSLTIWDRLYSYVLGRSAMLRDDEFDVNPPIDVESDGSRLTHETFQAQFFRLSVVVGEAGIKCNGVRPPAYATVLEMDRKFAEWERQLPPVFLWRDSSADSSSFTSYSGTSSGGATLKQNISQRQVVYALATWYLSCRMNLHRTYLTIDPPILPLPDGLARSSWQSPVLSRERCLELAVEVILVQHTAYENHPVPMPERPLHFADIFFAFDSAVNLMWTISQPHYARSSHYEELIKWVESMLQSIGASERSPEAELAQKSMAVLKAVRKDQEKLKELRAASPHVDAPDSHGGRYAWHSSVERVDAEAEAQGRRSLRTTDSDTINSFQNATNYSALYHLAHASMYRQPSAQTSPSESPPSSSSNSSYFSGTNSSSGSSNWNLPLPPTILPSSSFSSQLLHGGVSNGTNFGLNLTQTLNRT